METRNKLQKFPDPFELTEDVERALWIPRRDRIFVSSTFKPKTISWDIETIPTKTLLYTIDWDAALAQLNKEFLDMKTRRELAEVQGFCDECTGFNIPTTPSRDILVKDATWNGVTRSSEPMWRRR